MLTLHRYLIRLENSRHANPSETIPLLIELRGLAGEFGSVVKNLRVSERAIEFDLYVLNEESKIRTVSKLEKLGKKLGEKDLELEQIPIDKSLVLKDSVDLFNEQRYWECHETLEQIWRRERKGAEKDVQQGIILTASAFVHFQKNESDVCLGMIPRTLQKLESWKEQKYFTIDVGNLKDNLKKIYDSQKIMLFKI